MTANRQISKLRDKIESIKFPIKATCNQSNNWNAKEAKRMNLSRRFIPNPKPPKSS